MKTHLTKLQTMLAGLIEKAKVRKGLLSILGIFFVLQVYFVRELIAAELLFVTGLRGPDGLGRDCLSRRRHR